MTNVVLTDRPAPTAVVTTQGAARSEREADRTGRLA